MTSASNDPASLRVLDLTDGAANGLREALLRRRASVLIVEPLDGAESDSLPIAWPAPGAASTLHLDLTCGPDRDALLAVAREASVFVEAWRPGFAEILGFGYDAISAQNARLVYVSLQSAELQDSDEVVAALQQAAATAAKSAVGEHLVLR